MNINSIEELQERQNILKLLKVDEDSINDFRSKCAVVSKEKADELGQSIFVSIKFLRSTTVEEVIEAELEEIQKMILAGANLNVVVKDEKNGILLPEEKQKHDTLLLKAVKRFAPLELFLMLIRAGADINAVNKSGSSFTMWISRRNNVEILALLILMGANINIKPNDGDTALHSAAKHNSTEAAELLADNNALIEANNNTMHNIHDLATFRKNKEVIKIIEKSLLVLDLEMKKKVMLEFLEIEEEETSYKLEKLKALKNLK